MDMMMTMTMTKTNDKDKNNKRMIRGPQKDKNNGIED